MSLRARIFIIVSIAALLVLAISLALVASNKKKKEAANTQTQTQEQAGVSPSNVIDSSNFNTNFNSANVSGGIAPTTAIGTVEMEQNSVKQLAKIFIERYGSYSTDNNFQNIKDVEDLVTDELWGKINKTSAATSTFMSVLTKAISVNLTNRQSSSAEVSIKTIRTTDQNGTVSQKTQGVKVSLVKQGENWLVSKFEWEK